MLNKSLGGALLGATLALSGAFYAGRVTADAPETVTRLKAVEVEVLFAKEIVVAENFDPDVVNSWLRAKIRKPREYDGAAYISAEMFKLENDRGAPLAAVTPGHLELIGKKTKGRIAAEADGAEGRAEIRLFQGTQGRDYSVIVAGAELESFKPPR